MTSSPALLTPRGSVSPEIASEQLFQRLSGGGVISSREYVAITRQLHRCGGAESLNKFVNGRTFVYAACQLNQLGIVEECCAQLPDIDFKKGNLANGETPFLLALRMALDFQLVKSCRACRLQCQAANRPDLSPRERDQQRCRQHRPADLRLLESLQKVSVKIDPARMDVGTARFDNVTPLLAACLRENANVVRCLLRFRSIDLDSTTEEGNTVLHLACRSSSTALLVAILESGRYRHGAFEQKNNAGETPILLACRSANGQAVEVLVNYMAKDSASHHRHLHLACGYGNVAMVKGILGKDGVCGLNDRSAEGITPFLAAVQTGNRAVVEYLISLARLQTIDYSAYQ